MQILHNDMYGNNGLDKALDFIAFFGFSELNPEEDDDDDFADRSMFSITIESLTLLFCHY